MRQLGRVLKHYATIKCLALAADLSLVVIPIQRSSLAWQLRDPEPVPIVDVCCVDPEDTAEQYLLGLLSPAEAKRFEEHYMICETCAEALSAAEDYITSIRVAGLRLAKSGLHLV